MYVSQPSSGVSKPLFLVVSHWFSIGRILFNYFTSLNCFHLHYSIVNQTRLLSINSGTSADFAAHDGCIAPNGF